MQIFKDLDNIKTRPKTVVAIGVFDGVHPGHKKIIEHLKKSSEKNNLDNFLITFEPHPKKILGKDKDLKYLTTIDEKIELLNDLNIRNILIINFTKEFSQLTADKFIHKIVDKLEVAEFVVGYDHHFGKGRGGDEATLKELGEKLNFKVSVIPPVEINGEIISSTKIREALIKGEIKKGNVFLDRSYSFKGAVVKGDSRGEKLGFPTANIEPSDQDKLIPATGVYAVEVLIENERKNGMMNIGTRPTFTDSQKTVIETNIFDFNKDIYGKEIEIRVIERIREEKKFSSVDQLINEMNKDKVKTLEILQMLKN